MARRSNLIVALGLAVFIIGAGATFLIARHNGSSSTPAAGKVNVLYAAKPIPTGTTGSSALDNGLVKTKAIDAAAKPVNALTDPSQLAGQTARLGVPEGQVLSADQFTEAQTRIGTLNIPDGKVALALQLSYVPGVAGYAGAGDHIDIFAVDKDATGGATSKLIMQNIEVLSYNGAALASAQGQPGGTAPVYLLAVDPTAAEQLVFLTSFEQLYFALVANNQTPVSGTPGVNNSQALKVL